MSREIKKSVPMMWVEVAFGSQVEILYFEGTEEVLKRKMQFDFVYFENYRRNVATSKIKDFWEVDSEYQKTRESKLASLNTEQKEQVKEFIKNFKKNLGKEPTDKEIDRMIFKAVHGCLPEDLEEKRKTESRLWEYWRKKTIKIIAKMRENKKKFWSYKI